MTWNHRVVRKVYPKGEILFGIHEVFYDDGGTPDLITEEPVAVQDDNIEGLIQTLKWMMKAVRHPILEYADFEDSGKYRHG